MSDQDRELIAALRGALAAAVAEIETHNNEYRHRTPEARLDAWRRLCSEKVPE